MRVTILGCGPAGGVPSVSGGWGKCDPANPRNRRRRSSLLVEQGREVVLVDTSPDLREQLLDADVRRLSAVLYTHDHADHLHGIDDLREVNRAIGAALPVYGAADVLGMISDRFPYVLTPLEGTYFYKPVLRLIEVTGPFRIGEMTVVPFEQDHGTCTSLGFRFGDMAYSTDVVKLDETAFRVLEGVRLWIVDVLSEKPHPTHAHLDLALEWIARVKPERAVLTHMTAGLDYGDLRRRLPAGVEPAYDGMVLEV